MFLETAEKINTINKIVAGSFNSWSFTLIFGMCFLLLFGLVILYREPLLMASKKFNGRTALMVLIILVWAPMFFDNIISANFNVFERVKLITSSSQDKGQVRLCLVDKNQKLGNKVCLMLPFVKEVKNLVPAQAKLAVASSDFYSIFLPYYLASDYQLTSPDLADYWLLYMPVSGYELSGNQELLEITGETKKNWGRWQVLKKFNEGMIILKRL